MKPSARLPIAPLFAVVLFLAGVPSGLADDTLTKPDPENAALAARGRALYAQHCASCHGVNLEGQPNWRKRLANGRLPAPPHDPSGHTWHHSDDQLFDMVKYGTAAMMPPGYETDMPAYKDLLSDRDIGAVLSFIESTWPAEIRQRQQRLTRSTR